MAKLPTFSAKGLSDLVKEGSYTATAITEAFFERIDLYDAQVGAFLALFKERALAKAEEVDKKRAQGATLGRLAGVPVALKDNMHVKGELTTCGSKFLTNYSALFDATVTELLEKEDAIIIGKTNLDEFAMGSSTEKSALKKTSNPWNLSTVPGGSSGGSAAAVAARLCPLALGSDTGGSIRQPASFCGVLGMKPSYGRVSRYGLVAFGSSLDQIGPFANCSADIALAMEVLGQHDPRDATSLHHPSEDYFSGLAVSLQGKRVGIPWEFLEDLSSETRSNFEESLRLFQSLGVQIVPIDLNILKYSVATYYVLATAEASTNLARFDGIRYGVRAPQAKNLEEVYDLSRKEGFGPEVKKRILLGTYVLSSGFQDAYYKQAARVRVKIIETYSKAFEQCDVVLTPTAPTTAFAHGAIHDPLQMYLQDIYTIGANLARLPAISFPSGFDAEGKPFGIQITGPFKEDRLICRFAHAFETLAPFSSKLPANFA